MPWKLRDTRLHEVLDEATKGEFSKKLIEAVKSGSMVVDISSGSPKLSVHLVGNDIEDVPGYDPFKWNDYPAVKPPKGVWMRVEGKVACYFFTLARPFSRSVKGCARFGDFCGKEQWGDEVGQPLDMMVTRFRPWEDEDHVPR